MAKLKLERTEKGNFKVNFGNFETYLTFPEVVDAFETLRDVVTEEESRILQEELNGDFVCDGCTI